MRETLSCVSCPHASFAGLKEQVLELIHCLRGLMYPDIFKECGESCRRGDDPLETAVRLLGGVLRRVVTDGRDAAAMARELAAELDEVKALLETDIQAAFEGDPAATCREEVMLAYPTFEAVSIYRLANRLYRRRVPIIPRMMTEYAHRLTGIDIHPGAEIGPYFFIDHGTGVVIGETTTIGDHVKLYQGVTLGAKSFAVNDDGTLVKGVKRHPDLGSGVVVYAGATILGGGTVIGDRCVIGGNVWLTHSVPADTTVLAAHEQASASSVRLMPKGGAR